MASPALQLSRGLARKLFSFGAEGGVRTVGCSSAKCCAFSTQDNDDSGVFSESKVPEGDSPDEDTHQGLTDPASESFLFDPPPSFQTFSDPEPESASVDSPPYNDPPNMDGGQPDQLPSESPRGLPITDRPLAEGYSPRTIFSPRGVYKAILLGEVGQPPVQKILKSGRSITIFAVGTGGIHNNRRPFEGESPEEFAERSYTQWHRVAVYQEKVGGLAMRSMKQGTQVYVEGNIETRIYNDPASGTVKRIREIAIRQNGRLLFMDQPTTARPEFSPLFTDQPTTARADFAQDRENTSVFAQDRENTSVSAQGIEDTSEAAQNQEEAPGQPMRPLDFV